VQQVYKSCGTCFKFHCMFYFTCDRSFSPAYKAAPHASPARNPHIDRSHISVETHITSCTEPRRPGAVWPVLRSITADNKTTPGRPASARWTSSLPTHGAKRFMIPSETGDRWAAGRRGCYGVFPVDAATLNWTLRISRRRLQTCPISTGNCPHRTGQKNANSMT